MCMEIVGKLFPGALSLTAREFQVFSFLRNRAGVIRPIWKQKVRTADLFRFTVGHCSRSFGGRPSGFIFSLLQCSSEITTMRHASNQPFVIAEDEALAENGSSDGVVSKTSEEEFPHGAEALRGDGTSDRFVSGPSKQELSPGNEALADVGANDGVVSRTSKQEPELLEAHGDKYDGVIVDPDKLPMDVPSFVSSLKASLSEWRDQGKRGVWLKVPIDHAKLVPAAIEEGFWYHHAEPTYVMLTYWIPESPCTLPANASHQVGIGAFVVNDKREVLAVQEKIGPLSGLGVWKMPTGIILQGEDIFTGAMREVKEETDVQIDADFLEVVGFRHSHHVAFEKSDLFFVCILRPLSSNIVIQQSEIEAAQWMPLEEFAAQPFYQEHDVLNKILSVCIASTEKRHQGFSAVHTISKSNMYPSNLYYHVLNMN